MTVNVSFWGVRGSIPCCSPEYTEYGGNTSCVHIDLDGKTVILDAGSGLRMLGNRLAEQNVTDIALLISHAHWDHICGFLFFAPLFKKDSRVKIYASLQQDGLLANEIFVRLMAPPFFPLPLDGLPSTPRFHDFRASEPFDLFDGQVRVETIALNHPNNATGYRLNYKGKSVSYISDHEHGTKEDFDKLAAFVKDSDMMIYDAMYTPEEYPNFKGWGHSTWEQAALLTRAANIGKTALFHHAPAHTDAMMREIEQKAKDFDFRLFAAKENMTVAL